MELGEYFRRIASEYRREDGLSTPTQALLKNAAGMLAEHTPVGAVVQGSGGKGVATYTPWIGFFDPDETDSPQRGIYIVYLFSQDLRSLALTLNQGMEYLRKDLGNAEARRRLAQDAEAIRSEVADLSPFDDQIDLRSTGDRQKAYEAGNISCRMYDLQNLPSEDVLRSDLAQQHLLYERAIEAKRRLLLEEPGTIATPSGGASVSRPDPLINFRPKDDADYKSVLVGKELVKSRRHESLVTTFAHWSASLGYAVSSPHPEDLLLVEGGKTILIEAKMVYRGNATEAVRAAVGQLTMYAHFLHSHENPPKLIALFSEDVGGAYRQFLERLGIGVVWWSKGDWYGSESAVALGVADSP